MDKILSMIGLAKRAGRLDAGEEPVGAAARARDARLILVASDAAENSVRRVRHFADAGQCLWIKIPATKDELGRAVGRSSCAMAAVNDIGFAEAIAKKLAQQDERYQITAEKLGIKAQRAAQRRKEAEQHRKNLRTGKFSSKTAGEVKQEEKERRQGASDPQVRAVPRMNREERRREAVKRAARARYQTARPVKKGKGSSQKKR